MANNHQENPPAADLPGWLRVTKELVTILVAVLAIVAFGVVIAVLFARLDLSDREWTRATYLLNGVEAVAFAAAGFLFGREVNRQRAEKAEEAVDKANSDAQAANKNATEAQQAKTEAETKIRALQSAINAKVTAGAALESEAAGRGAGGSLAELKQFADELLGS
jgi:hypothetical protein